MNSVLGKRPARVAAIHDLSTFGRCSLSVILPVMSAMGVQVCPIPTAVLSSHTGGLGNPEIRDLTDFMEPCLEHYGRIPVELEGVYTGFLASVEQVEHCLSFFGKYKNALHIVDPVMGDHGKSYKSCGKELQKGMMELVRAADVITPNVTEAAMLLDIPFTDRAMSGSEAKSVLVRLAALGPKRVIVTGVRMLDGTVCNVLYDSLDSSFWRVSCDYVPAAYPGTGDMFAAVLVGAILCGGSFPMALDKATKFCELSVKTTYSFGSDPMHGVMFELCLSYLTANTITGGYETL